MYLHDVIESKISSHFITLELTFLGFFGKKIGSLLNSSLEICWLCFRGVDRHLSCCSVRPKS